MEGTRNASGVEFISSATLRAGDDCGEGTRGAYSTFELSLYEAEDLTGEVLVQVEGRAAVEVGESELYGFESSSGAEEFSIESHHLNLNLHPQHHHHFHHHQPLSHHQHKQIPTVLLPPTPPSPFLPLKLDLVPRSASLSSPSTSPFPRPAFPSPSLQRNTTNRLSGNEKCKSTKRLPRMFRCTGYGDCAMVFTRSEHLARHVRKHTGERPFKCHCGRTFSRLDNVRQHAGTVHAEQPAKNAATMAALVALHNSLSASSAASQIEKGMVIKDPAGSAVVKKKRVKSTGTGPGTSVGEGSEGSVGGGQGGVGLDEGGFGVNGAISPRGQRGMQAQQQQHLQHQQYQQQPPQPQLYQPRYQDHYSQYPQQSQQPYSIPVPLYASDHLQQPHYHHPGLTSTTPPPPQGLDQGSPHNSPRRRDRLTPTSTAGGGAGTPTNLGPPSPMGGPPSHGSGGRYFSGGGGGGASGGYNGGSGGPPTSPPTPPQAPGTPNRVTLPSISQLLPSPFARNGATNQQGATVSFIAGSAEEAAYYQELQRHESQTQVRAQQQMQQQQQQQQQQMQQQQYMHHQQQQQQMQQHHLHQQQQQQHHPHQQQQQQQHLQQHLQYQQHYSQHQLPSPGSGPGSGNHSRTTSLGTGFLPPSSHPSHPSHPSHHPGNGGMHQQGMQQMGYQQGGPSGGYYGPPGGGEVQQVQYGRGHASGANSPSLSNSSSFSGDQDAPLLPNYSTSFIPPAPPSYLKPAFPLPPPPVSSAPYALPPPPDHLSHLSHPHSHPHHQQHDFYNNNGIPPRPHSSQQKYSPTTAATSRESSERSTNWNTLVVDPALQGQGQGPPEEVRVKQESTAAFDEELLGEGRRSRGPGSGTNEEEGDWKRPIVRV